MRKTTESTRFEHFSFSEERKREAVADFGGGSKIIYKAEDWEDKSKGVIQG